MIKNLKKKLGSQTGESLAETLISLLIASLALVMLAGAMTTASSVLTRSREKLGGENGYYSQTEPLVKMESGTASTIEISGTSTISGTTVKLDQHVDIVYNKNDAFSKTPVIAYKSIQVNE